jgi:phosphatidylglycerophosphate synthase
VAQQHQGYVRTNAAFTAAVERRLLLAMAARLPARVLPNHLTIIGLAGSLLTCVSFALSTWGRGWLLMTLAGMIINWAGDSLDGTLARLRRIERPRFGMFVDQAADLLSIFLVMLGFGLSPWVHLEVAGVAYIAYLLTAVIMHLKAGVLGTYELAQGRFGPSEGRLLLAFLVVLMLLVPPPPGGVMVGALSGFDLALLAVSGGLVIAAVAQVTTVARRLSREEPSGGARPDA